MICTYCLNDNPIYHALYKSDLVVAVAYRADLYIYVTQFEE